MRKTMVAVTTVLTMAMMALTPATPAAASDHPPVLTQCWTPQQLTGNPGENLVHRSNQKVAMPSLEGLHLTPVGTVGAVRRVKLPKGRKLVALTFDLCETAWEISGYDGAVVDYLRANSVKATFFAGGKWMLDHSERAQQLIADERFEVGTHGWVHANLHVLTGRAAADEILGATAAYDATRHALAAKSCMQSAGHQRLSSTKQPKVFRFPFGACNADSLQAAAQAGLYAIQWDVSTGDPSPGANAASIARAVINGVKPGSIIIAHANGRGWHTAEALRLFIPEMRKRGYEFVTVSELMAAGTPEVVPTCYDRRPGDSDRYDALQPRQNRTQMSGAARRTTAPSAWPAILETPH